MNVCYGWRCGPAQSRGDFDCKVEKTEGGVTITVTAKEPRKAEALQKMAEAQRVLCGEGCCC